MTRRLNAKFLACLLVATVLLGLGVHFVHGFQLRRNAHALLARADQAEQAGRRDQALDYLERYLALAPTDTESLARYGLLLGQQASTANNPVLRAKAFFVLSNVIGRQPERTAVRRQLVRLAMDPSLGRFSDAKEHLAVLLEASPHDAALEADLGRCCEANGEYEEAVAWFQKVSRDAPGQLASYLGAANLLEHRLGRSAKAAATLDAMVQANEHSAQAHQARAGYYLERARSAKEANSAQAAAAALRNAARDVSRALELAGGEAEVLLTAAQLAEANNDLDAARAHLEKGIQLHPNEPRFYLMLARMERQAGRRPQALACLRRGLKRLPDRVALLCALAELLIETGESDGGLVEARQILDRLSKANVSAALLDYLRARALINQARPAWAEAAQLLEKSRGLLARDRPDLARQADLFLGACYKQRGDVDQAYAAYRRAAAADPLGLPACLGMADTLTAMDRTGEALELYRKVVDKAPEVRLRMARLLIRRNLTRPEPQRAWDEVDRLLKEAAQALPASTDVPILRAEMLAAQPGSRDQALAELTAARDKQPTKAELWTALAALTQRQGDPAKARAILDEARRQLGDRAELRGAAAGYWARRGGTEARKALAQLANGIEKFPAGERERLLDALASAFLQVGEAAEAERLWTRLAQEQPGNAAVRLILFDLALQAGNEAGMKRLLEGLQELEGAAVLRSYARACYLIWRAEQGHTEDLGEARLLLASVASQRPSWSRVPRSEARICELENEPEGAIRNYQRAVELGERDPGVLRRLVQLLYQRHRYAEADEVLARLPAQALDSRELLRTGIDVSLRTQNYARALELAEKAVAAPSRDYRDYIWYAQVLSAVQRRREAEAALRRAVGLADNVADTWVALVRYLARTGQKEKAEAALQQAERKLAGDQAALGVASCYEAVGRKDRAQELYRTALAAKPEDITVLRAVADFYLRSGKPREARPELEKILHLKDKAPNVAAWARRTLAVVLAASGDYQQLRQALALLGLLDEAGPQDAPASEAIEELRARATVLAVQHRREPRRKAIRLLEEVIARQPPTADDQFLLAQLYEASHDWAKARKQMLSVLAAHGDNPLYVAFYARTLLKHDETDPAQFWLNRLDELEPAALRTVEIKARLLKHQGKGAEAVSVLRAYTRGKDANLPFVARLLEELGESAAAEAMYREVAALASRPDGVLLLAQYLGRQHRVREALDLCEKAWQTCPPAAVANTTIGVLYSGTVEPRQIERVERWLQAALEKGPNDPAILLSLAHVRNLQGRYPEAEAFYRETLRRDRRNTVALNNLAWILALFRGEGSEALALIDQALEIAGPEPSLLDTRGAVALRLNQADRALADLGEVVQESPTPARYFHLAQAQLLAGRQAEARAALQRAQASGLTPQRLDPLERPAYQQVLEALARQ